MRKHARDKSDTLCYSILREEWEENNVYNFRFSLLTGNGDYKNIFRSKSRNEPHLKSQGAVHLNFLRIE